MGEVAGAAEAAEPPPEDEGARVARERELAAYEEKFGRRMQVDIARRNARRAELRARAAAERALMAREENRSAELSRAYRAELARRAEERRVALLAAEAAGPRLAGVERAVTQALQPAQRRR